MKKTLALVMSVLLALVLVACGGDSSSTSSAPESPDAAAEESADASTADDSTDAAAEESGGEEASSSAFNVKPGDTIGVSLTSRAAERWLRDGETLEAALTAAGYVADVQYADSLPQNQVQQIENMITKGCTALIIAPVDNGSLSAVLETAKEQNILIINYDLGIVGSDNIDYFVGFDNSKVGAMQAQSIIDGLGLANGEKGPFNIELVAGSLAEANCYMYFDGALELLQPYMDEGVLVVKSGQLTIEQCTVENWKLEALASRLDNLLTTYYSDGTLLDAVLSPSDYLSGPIATRLMEMGYGSDPDMPMPIITGNDATEAVVKMIAKDQVTMSVFKDTRLLADACMSIINSVAEGKTPEVNGEYTPDTYTIPTIFVDMYALDKSNLEELVIDTGFYTEEQVYG